MTPVYIGLIVAHAAFPAVFATYPQRQFEGVDGYVGVSDCSEMGRFFVLVRRGQPDVLVAVADCAADQHVAVRASRGLIADVDVALWRGPWREQPAELWRPADRARWWKRAERDQ